MTSTHVTDQGMFPAEHRALRELYATARQLERHWSRLAGRLGAPAAAPLPAGTHAIGALLAELAEIGQRRVGPAEDPPGGHHHAEPGGRRSRADDAAEPHRRGARLGGRAAR